MSVMYQKPVSSQPSAGYTRIQPMYGEFPVDLFCPYCQTRVMSSTTLQDGNLTYTASALCCVMGCWLGCCLIPFFLDSCKDVIHTCPNCRAPLGKYNRLC